MSFENQLYSWKFNNSFINNSESYFSMFNNFNTNNSYFLSNNLFLSTNKFSTTPLFTFGNKYSSFNYNNYFPSNLNNWAFQEMKTFENYNYNDFNNFTNKIASYNENNQRLNLFTYNSNNFNYSPPKKISKQNYNNDFVFRTKISGDIDNSYANLSQNKALEKAKNDTRLEKLSGSSKWSVANTFRTDIPYAKKGTSKILDKVASLVGEELVITSALATRGTSSQRSPHVLGGYASHHNAENPKLDIKINNPAHGKELAKKLKATGYFSHILIESDHLDVQINPKKYETLSALA